MEFICHKAKKDYWGSVRGLWRDNRQWERGMNKNREDKRDRERRDYPNETHHFICKFKNFKKL